MKTLTILLLSLSVVCAANAADMSSPPNSLVVSDTGNVGIGTAAPTETVDVHREGGGGRFRVRTYDNTASSQYVMSRAYGTASSPLAVPGYKNLGQFSFRGYNGTAFTGSRAVITVQSTQNWTTVGNGTRLLFQATPNGSTTPQQVLVIMGDGSVNIPNGGLTVQGTPVPDYVFADDYELMPIEDLQAFIEKERHLPNVPSATEVAANGLDLGRTQMAMLEKVEELTLYTVQQHLQINDQQRALVQQKERLHKLELENSELRKTLESRLRLLEIKLLPSQD